MSFYRMVIVWHHRAVCKSSGQTGVCWKMGIQWNWMALLKYVNFVSAFKGNQAKWLAACLTGRSASRQAGPERFLLFHQNCHNASLSLWHWTYRISNFSDFITQWKAFFWSALSYLQGFFCSSPPALSSLLLLCLLENQFIWGSIVMVCFVFPPPCSSASIISDLHVYCLEVNSLSCSFTRYFLPKGLSFWHLENVISALPTDELQAAAANSTAPSFAVHTQTQQGRKESSIVWISFYTPRIFFLRDFT